jgi:hypothetical protein
MDFDFDFRIPIDIMNFQDDADFGMDHQMGQQDLVKKIYLQYLFLDIYQSSVQTCYL